MKHISITILGEPKPKQSARFAVRNGRIHKYQSETVTSHERNLAYDAKSQLPVNFKPFTGPLKVEATFVFPPLKSFSKTKIRKIENGEIFFKDTKPDLQDNLFKLTADSLEGIVYLNDSQISEVHSRKIYGTVPRIELKFTELINS